MDTVPITPNLAMLRIKGWQVYVWRDDDSVTLIDTGAPGSSAEILCAVPGVDRIVLTHGHVDHCGSAAELHQATGAPVLAGAGDAAAIPDRCGSAATRVRGLGSPYLSTGFGRPTRRGTASAGGPGACRRRRARLRRRRRDPGYPRPHRGQHRDPPTAPRHAVHRGHHRQCRHRHAGHLQPGPGTNRRVVSAVGRARRRDSLLRPWRADRLRCR